MQPNPAAGPPSVPQALNRYAATSEGQVGVVQAEASNPFATAIWHQTLGAAIGLAIDLTPASKAVEEQLWGLIEISYLPTRGVAGAVSWFTTGMIGRSLTRLPFGLGEKVAAKYAGRSRSLLVEMRLDKGGSLVDELSEASAVVSSRYADARLMRQWEVSIVKRGMYGSLFKHRDLWAGATFSGIASGGFQLYNDWDNPYLTKWQKAQRAGLSTITAFTAAYAGAKIGAAIGTMIEPVGGTIGGAIGGFILGLTVELWGTPQIFEWVGAIPEHDLAPLP